MHAPQDKMTRMPIPVLLMVRELHQGGSERQMTEMARGLSRDTFFPHVGCFRPGGLRGDQLRAEGIPVAHFPVYSYKSMGAIDGAQQLARYVKENGIRLVHTFDVPLNVFGVPVAKMLTSAVALSSQRAHRELASPGYRTLLKIVDRVADGIVVNCEFLKRHLVEDEGVTEEKIRLCYNGIDLTQFQPTPRERGPLTIGVVCALRPEKGLPTLVEAFGRVAKKRPDLRLAVVGSGPVLEELQKRACELNVANQCHWEPATKEVAAWMRKIDIFVLPSLSEALSNSLMEAMACGCCVVASRVGGNPELVADGERGLLFEKQDVNGLTAALERLVENEEARCNMALNGKRFIHEKFSLKAAAQQMGTIYEEFLEKKRR